MSDGAVAPFNVDLSNCDKQPIHLPGQIQPHGVLLAFDPASLHLVQCSENLAALLDADIETLLAANAAGLLSESVVETLLRIADEGVDGAVVPVRSSLTGPGLPPPEALRDLPGAAHLFDGVLILELELPVTLPRAGSTALTQDSTPLLLKNAIARMQAAADMPDLYRVIAEEVRSYTGFDRVMVYQFQSDGHGIVVGEAAAEGLERFLGLHYPASDIPPQARRLYELNPLRLIADINAPPVAIVPPLSPVHGRPLDLTHASFRSVSPIHVEYLQNMGVGASMSISLMRDDSLWGLIACHHRSPYYIPLNVRAGCEMLGNTAAAHLVSQERNAESEERVERRMLLSGCVRTIASKESWEHGLAAAAEPLADLMHAGGFACLLEGRLSLHGETPTAADVHEILDAFPRENTGPVLATDCLSVELPHAERYANVASGLLLLRFQTRPDDALLFFRPEYAREVVWGGDPRKSIETSNDGLRLSPRKSFAAWKETVRHRSREWTPTDLRLAGDLQAEFLLLLARRTAELERLNTDLARINEDLDAFAYVASHDLKQPLRGVHQTLFFLERAMNEGRMEEVQHRIQALKRITREMDGMLEGLLRLSRSGRVDLQHETVQLDDVVQEAVEIALGAKDRELVELVLHPLPCVIGDHMCLREVFCNLLSNAFKYSDGGIRRIEVGALPRSAAPGLPPESNAEQVIYVKDNGIGIAAQHQSSIFQVFRRLHLPEQYGGGHGAGLAIVKRIIDRHGGAIWVRSEPGSGSTFYFTVGNGNP